MFTRIRKCVLHVTLVIYLERWGICDIFTWYRPERYVCNTVPFQIFNSNVENNSFQLAQRAFPSSFFFFSLFLFWFFFLKKRGFFFQGARGAIIGFTARAFQTDATIRLAIFFKELFKNISEIYLQGRLTVKAQTVCLDLGPLCSISTSLPPCQSH